MASVSMSDGELDGWVPSLDHASFSDWDAVYEPSEDTFLLLDGLFAERAALRDLAPRTVAEIGPGSGVVSAYVSRLLAAQRPWQVCVDLNPKACDLTARTAKANGAARVDVVRGDLGTRLSARGQNTGDSSALQREWVNDHIYVSRDLHPLVERP